MCGVEPPSDQDGVSLAFTRVCGVLREVGHARLLASPRNSAEVRIPGRGEPEAMSIGDQMRIRADG
jgi:hypothetical protein